MFTIFARRAAFSMSLFSLSAGSTCNQLTHLTNHDYFYCGKNPKTPNLSPMPGSRWRMVWYLPPLYLWSSTQMKVCMGEIFKIEFQTKVARARARVCFSMVVSMFSDEETRNWQQRQQQHSEVFLFYLLNFKRCFRISKSFPFFMFLEM